MLYVLDFNFSLHRDISCSFPHNIAEVTIPNLSEYADVFNLSVDNVVGQKSGTNCFRMGLIQEF